jgi:hypothetical protein
VAFAACTGKSMPNAKTHAVESTIDTIDLAETFTTSEDAERTLCDFMERFSTEWIARQR